MKNLDHVMMDDNTSSFNVKWSNYVTQAVTDWYQKETQKTAVYPKNMESAYLFSALASEVGEACGKYAKFLRDESYPAEQYLKDVKAELGDVLWNISQSRYVYAYKTLGQNLWLQAPYCGEGHESTPIYHPSTTCSTANWEAREVKIEVAR